MNTKIQNKIAMSILWFTGILILGILCLFLGYILYKGMPVLSAQFIFGRSSDITAGGGVGSQLFNSFYLLLLSLAISVPIAVGAGIYLAEYASIHMLLHKQ